MIIPLWRSSMKGVGWQRAHRRQVDWHQVLLLAEECFWRDAVQHHRYSNKSALEYGEQSTSLSLDDTLNAAICVTSLWGRGAAALLFPLVYIA